MEMAGNERASLTPARMLTCSSLGTDVEPSRQVFKSLEMKVWTLGYFSILIPGKQAAADFSFILEREGHIFLFEIILLSLPLTLVQLVNRTISHPSGWPRLLQKDCPCRAKQ